MKYCGVATSFKGVRVYTRGAMGMSRLAQVHSLDQSTIPVIQDPICCFLIRDPQTDGKNGLVQTTLNQPCEEQSSIKQTFQRVPEESTWASLGHVWLSNSHGTAFKQISKRSHSKKVL